MPTDLRSVEPVAPPSRTGRVRAALSGPRLLVGLIALLIVPGALGVSALTYETPALTYAATAEEAVTGADVVLLLTEWPEYTRLDPAALATLTRNPSIIDGRNALDPTTWRNAGWTYRGIGRPAEISAPRATRPLMNDAKLAA